MKSPKKISRGNDRLAEAVELEVVDAHVAALGHAEAEFDAALVDDVVEAEVIFGTEQRAVGYRCARGVDAQQRGDVALEVSATHVEAI